MLTLVAGAAIGLIAPGAAHATPDLQLTDIAGSTTFTKPVYVTSPPGDASRVFVVQQSGQVMLVKGGVVSTFLDLGTTKVKNTGEEGLQSIAFAPDYATSGLLYAFYSDATACTGSNCDDRVDEFHAATPDLADTPATYDRQVIAIPHQGSNSHHGGTLQFGADGLLYISTGDARVSANAQDTTVLNGKILRIDPRNATPYAVPGDNPFVGQPPARPEIWAYGLRNPWRFSFDGYTGDLVVPDVGETSREEINLIPGGDASGKNFEWGTCEGEFATPESTPPIPCPLSGPGYVSPVLTYGHDEWNKAGDACGTGGAALIGGVVVRDLRLPPAYAGRYFYGDYCHQYAWTANLEAGSIAAVHSTIQDTGLTVGTGVTSIGPDAACRIYITSQGGWVKRVDPGPGITTGPVGCATPPPPPPPPATTGPDQAQPPTPGTSSPGAVAIVDRTRPIVSRVEIVRTRFAVGQGPTAINAVARGTAFRFTLSTAGVVTIRIVRTSPGRRVGRPCLAPTRARRHRPSCTRLTDAGILTRRLVQGRRSVPFSGRIGRRPLSPGHYRATLIERKAGQVSRSHTLSFTIVAG
jgi:hypothetical protein